MQTHNMIDGTKWKQPLALFLKDSGEVLSSGDRALQKGLSVFSV